MPTSLWQQTFDYARQIYTLTKSSTRHDAEIKELQRQVKDLTTGMQLFVIQRQQDQETAAKDREILVLRLENRLLRRDRGLLPPSGDAEDDVL